MGVLLIGPPVPTLLQHGWLHGLSLTDVTWVLANDREVTVHKCTTNTHIEVYLLAEVRLTRAYNTFVNVSVCVYVLRTKNEKKNYNFLNVCLFFLLF